MDLIRRGSGGEYHLCWRFPLPPSAVFFWVFLGGPFWFFSPWGLSLHTNRNMAPEEHDRWGYPHIPVLNTKLPIEHCGSWDSWLLFSRPLHKAYLLPLCFFSFTHIPIYSPTTTLDPVLLPTQRSLPAHSGFLAQSPTPNTNPPPPSLLDQA